MKRLSLQILVLVAAFFFQAMSMDSVGSADCYLSSLSNDEFFEGVDWSSKLLGTELEADFSDDEQTYCTALTQPLVLVDFSVPPLKEEAFALPIPSSYIVYKKLLEGEDSDTPDEDCSLVKLLTYRAMKELGLQPSDVVDRDPKYLKASDYEK